MNEKINRKRIPKAEKVKMNKETISKIQKSWDKSWIKEEKWLLHQITSKGKEVLLPKEGTDEQLDANSRNPETRRKVAEKTRDLKILKELSMDHNPWVRYEVAINTATPHKTRMTMATLDTEWLVYPALLSISSDMARERWAEIEEIYEARSKESAN